MHYTKQDITYEPFLKQQIFDSLKLKKFADDNFTFDENGREFYERVENAVGKWRNSLWQAIFPFPNSIFKRLVLQTCKNQGLFGNKRLNLNVKFSLQI